MTGRHIAIVFIGCATAVAGAWLSIWLALRAPASSATAPLLIIALGGQVATGALAHASQRAISSSRSSSGEHTPTGFAGRD